MSGRWHPKTWDYYEEPDPDYDPEKDYDRYEESCIEWAEFLNEQELCDDDDNS